MSSLPIDIRQVARSYGRRPALRGVDLQCAAGEMIGLVGANGSGKTTLLKIVAGLLRPDAGHVQVFGFSPYAQPTKVMQQARFAFAPPALYANLTAREHLQYLTRLHPESPVTDAEIDAMLQRVGLAPRRHDRVRTFSFGMRQRLVLAQALLPRPKLLVLDEPTDGLDPLGILELRNLLLDLRREWGISILLSSHLLVEIDHLVDRMVVLSEGKVAFAGEPRQLIERFQKTHIEAEPTARAAQTLRDNGHAIVERDDGLLELQDESTTLEAVRELLHAADVRLLSYHRARPSLEAALLQTLRDKEATP